MLPPKPKEAYQTFSLMIVMQDTRACFVLWRECSRMPDHWTLKNFTSRALVAYTYNPNYSGGRDQEDHGLKLAWTNSFRDPISKNPSQKKGLVEWLKV
jgi:hypothetical protein